MDIKIFFFSWLFYNLKTWYRFISISHDNVKGPKDNKWDCLRSKKEVKKHYFSKKRVQTQKVVLLSSRPAALIEHSASRSSIQDIGSGRTRLRRVTATFVRAIPPTRRSLLRSLASKRKKGNRIKKYQRVPLVVREKRARGHACVRAYV